jgi:putative DNA primase/helicase
MSTAPKTYNGNLAEPPVALAPLFKQKRFVNWRWVEKNGNWTKPPFQPARPGVYATNDKSDTWDTAWTAIGIVQAGMADGIGAALTGTSYCAIDLDHCHNPETGEIAPWAQAIVDRAPGAYVEVTVSGNGLRIIGVGAGPAAHHKFKIPNTLNGAGVEVYRKATRYITVSCQQLGQCERLTNIDDVIFHIISQYGQNSQRQEHTADTDDVDALIRDGAPLGKRSEGFARAVWSRAGIGRGADAIELELRRYPTGIASKFLAPKDRLRDEIDRCYKKWEQANAAPAREFSDIAFSDIALAQTFADENAQRLRFVPVLGKWFVWDGHRWEMDVKLTAREQTKATCRSEAAKCNKLKTAKLIASARTVSSVERLGQCDPQLVAIVEQFDSDPWLLNTPGGTFDLRSGKMRSHNPNDYITKITGITPDVEMPTPIWDAFLKHITAGDTELEGYLQRKTGYELTGVTREHALFFSYGTGANGKSTFLNAVTACLGDYHQTAPIETFTISNQDRHPTELARLRGARLVTATETEEGRRWAESRIKQLTGEDPVAARFMRQDFFEYRPQFKLDISGNHKPSLRSVDEAIRRRFNLIPFTVTIPPEQRDLDLGNKLKGELPGILAWAIRGCLQWQRIGLRPPRAVTEATTAYLLEEDSVTAWVDECCQRDVNAFVAQGEAFRSWKSWAEAAGEPVGPMKTLMQKLEVRGFTPHRKKAVRGLDGMRILPPRAGDWMEG